MLLPYGSHQSGKEWYDEIDNILKSLDFVKLQWCNSVYTLGGDVFLLLYVDDIIMFAKNDKLMCEVVTKLKTKINVLDLEKVKYILGVNFKEIENKYYLHQSTYIEKLMVKFEDLLQTYVNLTLRVGVVPPREEKEIIENEMMKKFSYRTLIGVVYPF